MNYLVLDFGGSSVKWAVMDDDYQILEQGTQAEGLGNKDELMATIAALYERTGRPAGGIAISFCSELDEESGLIFHGGSYPFMRGTNLVDEVGELCGCRVSVENDANCAALAEVAQGSLVGVRDAVMLVVGSGLGGAIVLDGEVRRGANKFAGEFSLMVDDIRADLAAESDFANMSILARDTAAAYLAGAYAAARMGTPGAELPRNGTRWWTPVTRLRPQCSSATARTLRK